MKTSRLLFTESSKLTPEKANATILRNLLMKELPKIVQGAVPYAPKGGSSNPYMPIQELRMVIQKNKHREKALEKIGAYLKTLGFEGDLKPKVEEDPKYPKETKYSISFKYKTDKVDRDYYDPSVKRPIDLSVFAYVSPDSETNAPTNIWITITGPKPAKRPPGSIYD